MPATATRFLTDRLRQCIFHVDPGRFMARKWRRCCSPAAARGGAAQRLLAARARLLHGRARSGGLPAGLRRPQGDPIRSGASPGQGIPARRHSRSKAVLPDIRCPPNDRATACTVATLLRPDARYLHPRAARSGAGAAMRGGGRTDSPGPCASARAARSDTGGRLSAASPLSSAGTDAARRGPCRRARIGRAMTGAAGPAAAAISPIPSPVSCRLRSGPLPSRDPRPAPRNRGRAAHRSSGPYDETHADRRHPRGRNPRRGAGR